MSFLGDMVLVAVASASASAAWAAVYGHYKVKAAKAMGAPTEEPTFDDAKKAAEFVMKGANIKKMRIQAMTGHLINREVNSLEDCIFEGYSLKQFEEEDKTYIRVSEDRNVCCFSMYLNKEKERAFVEEIIVTNPVYRGIGYGTMMMRMVENICRFAGKTHLTVVADKTTHMKEWLLRCGFTTGGQYEEWRKNEEGYILAEYSRYIYMYKTLTEAALF